MSTDIERNQRTSCGKSFELAPMDIDKVNDFQNDNKYYRMSDDNNQHKSVVTNVVIFL